jgi:hypothetical protein
MKSLTSLAVAAALTFGFLMPGHVVAGSRTVGPGQVVGMGEDWVLNGDDVLEVNGTADRPCRIDADARQLRSAPGWHGRVRIAHCEFRGLGSAKLPALDLAAHGDGDRIVIEDSEFFACGAIHLANHDESGTVFRRNTLHANSMVPVTNLPSESPPGFRATGRSTARKLFQGNRVDKSVVLFENTDRWEIGGTGDGEGNVILGLRGSLSLHGCDDMTVRGNYVHTEIPSFRWSQVHTLAVGNCRRLVVEHNVLRHGQWVVRGLAGEFRYNLVLDADAHQFIIGPTAGTHIHHNVFARYCTVDPNLNSTIAVIYKGDDIQVFNNTFDGGGKGLARPWRVPAIEVGPDGFLASLRNNVVYDHPTDVHNGTATVRPGFAEKLGDPVPARLGYADYNLFFNPDAKAKRNYGLRVDGKTERTDAGFGKNDVPAGGPKDAQADPKLKGPIPKAFPFADTDIRAGKVTVARILAQYRDAYSPAEGSPLVGAGDPADGPGSFIGAVGPGKDAPNDDFGRPVREKR